MITYHDFLIKVTDLKVSIHEPYHPFRLEGVFVYSGNRYDKKVVNPVPYIIQYWAAGGVSGGSCWDSSDPKPYRGEPAPRTFPDLDKILMAVAPNISFLQHRALEAAVLKEGEETEYEYYGNSTTYGYRLVTMPDLYAKLVEIGAIRS